MKIYDISMNINHYMPVYKNKLDKRPNLIVNKDFPADKVHESRICMDMHTGTHFDAPLHMIEGGDTIENYDINKAISKCKVLDMTNVNEKITVDDLKNKDIKSGEFILLKTKNSFDEVFNLEFIYLEMSGAEYLKEKSVIGVGIDSLGIERAQENHETHKILLNNNITILEGLRLKDIEEGEYTLFAAPLKIDRAEAAPARALLLKED
ncbi:cyclase family protein [Thermoanaerobacterium sp. RBIITD]|uniref:cyclase family protein n=1 Tax=Thermoanaerobacterium sp. RBIITD TaxID=1550240 RepID=UPI000BB7058D|nr:cyclase family protein [Thermoanaerobacterium sp. RBIITD]SNX52704.1 Kynurenine formamidase [Thermoanaerobacterium sp. RBIITD]